MMMRFLVKQFLNKIHAKTFFMIIKDKNYNNYRIKYLLNSKIDSQQCFEDIT